MLSCTIHLPLGRKKQPVVFGNVTRRFGKSDLSFLKNDLSFWEGLGTRKTSRKKGKKKATTDESLNALISCHLTDCCKDFIGALV